MTIVALVGVVWVSAVPIEYAEAIAARSLPASYRYSFNADGVVLETGKSEDSGSPYFWLSSGAKLIIKDGIGETIQGSLAADDDRRLLYAKMNPLDTGSGYYPQNTFRLIARSHWQDAETTLRFTITKTNLTQTPNRDHYSGVFLMGRYSDKDNLYYAGVRQDGLAILKKKIGGTYHTLAYTQVFGKQNDYNKNSRPNLIPQHTWLGLKARFTNQENGSVKIELLVDRDGSEKYTSVLSFVDSGVGGAPHRAGGSFGIRTDYMDVQFDNWDFKGLGAHVAAADPVSESAPASVVAVVSEPQEIVVPVAVPQTGSVEFPTPQQPVVEPIPQVQPPIQEPDVRPPKKPLLATVAHAAEVSQPEVRQPQVPDLIVQTLQPHAMPSPTSFLERVTKFLALIPRVIMAMAKQYTPVAASGVELVMTAGNTHLAQ